MVTLRRLLPVTALVFLVVTTGCLGVLSSDNLSFSASKATIETNAVSNAGYAHEETQKLYLNRTVEAGGQKKRVEVTNWAALYTKSASVGGADPQKVAAVAVLSSPEVKVLGQSFNPLAKLSDEELIKEVISRGGSMTSQGGVRDVEKVGSTKATILGERTDVTKFSATVEMDGQEIDAYVHVAKVTHDGDVVLVVGVYPKALSNEETNVLSMMQAVQH